MSTLFERVVGRFLAAHASQPPRGFREDPSTGQLFCPHRDVSCCPACAKRYPEIVEVGSQHFWTKTPHEKQELLRLMTAGAVVPFKAKPGVPVEVIHGRKYVLSTDGGPLGDVDDPGSGWLGDGGGARVIETPRAGSKWRFLWVYDTDKKYVAMWRVTDGNEKAGGSDRHFAAKIVQLDRKQQLNRVTHQEFLTVEREMGRREDALISQLQESIEQNKTDFQRTIDRLTLSYFEKNVAPKLERAVADVDAGAIPIGFEASPLGQQDEKAKRRQMYSYAVGQVLHRELTEEKVAQYCKRQGVNPDEPGVDNQAIYWAIGDLQELAYRRFLPAY